MDDHGPVPEANMDDDGAGSLPDGHISASDGPDTELAEEHDPPAANMHVGQDEATDEGGPSTPESVDSTRPQTGDKGTEYSLATDPPAAKLHLFPIEVLLSPPPDPDSYAKVALPPSWVVLRVIEEIDFGDETWYSVEFDDGRVDQLAYDDLAAMERGSHALNRFRRGHDYGIEQASMASTGFKRRRDDYESDGSGDGDSAPPTRPLRRSTRQKTTSRQHSVENETYGLDDDLTGIGISEDDDNDPFEEAKPGLGPNKRTTRAGNSTKKKYTYNFQSSDDELANNVNDDKDDFVPVQSDIMPKSSSRRRKGRLRLSRPQQRRRNGRESSIEFEATRKSGRTKQATSYVVPDIDDEYEAVEERTPVAPKHVSVKEIFLPLPRDSEFVHMHMITCDTCGGDSRSGKGPLIPCQGCSLSFHKVCLGQRSQREHRVTKIGTDSFVLQCRTCIGTYQNKDARAPNHAMCQTCKSDGASCAEFSTKKTPKYEERLRQENGGEDPVTDVQPDLINNSDTVLFRCTACKRGYHFEHLPPMTKDEVLPEDLRANRLEEYSMVDWRCKDCVDSHHKIQALVAWRPVDQGSYQAGATCFDYTEDQIEYLVHWERRSHFHDTWMPGAWIFGTSASTMRVAFNKREETMLPKFTSAAAIDEEWLLPDVLLNVRFGRNVASMSEAKALSRISDVKEVFVKFQGLSYTESVWDEPPPKESGAPWDAFCAAYEEYIHGLYFTHVPDHKMAERIKQYRGLHFVKECQLKTQPQGLKRGKLMEYQLEGVNWMLFNFHQAQNIILADEMGLGKTVQVVSLITSLVHDKPNCWPYLIVVPNSTCPNWRRELKQWAPELRVVTYHGGRAAQDLAYDHELFPDGVKAGMKAHVVIMSYEAAQDCKQAFRTVKWAGLVVDEGQRLKNDRSLLYLALKEMKIPFRLLLTGTPLQNNKRELFNLLQFIDSKHNAEALDLEYAEVTKENLRKLHALIRPYFLRRTKAQVLKFLPPMAQIILPVTMTYLQEKLSKSIIAKNPDLIKAIISKGRVKQGERKGLNNILMELRRCLCHPFLFSDSVEDRTITDPEKIQQNLVEASGKLMLLNIMLPKLKERGHRVLIFSQFLMSLTIIEDFLTAIGLQHARIDGNLSALEKQKRIDAFNAPDSPLFAMLLSTRAGGVGINLATADTVIIYDPDFNPHQDIQALSRAHRIGQKDKVLCFQMTTKDTVEEKIMQIGRKKMALDHALIESMDASDDAGDGLESILKHGAEALFSGDARDRIVYDEASVDKLLDRSLIESTNAGEDESAESQFSFARVWANDEGTLTANITEDTEENNGQVDSSVWENILKQREEEHERELAAQRQEYGRGARRRNQDIRYDGVGAFLEGINDDFLTAEQSHVQGDIDNDASSEGDGDFVGKDASEDSGLEEEYSENSAGAKRNKGAKAKGKAAKAPAGRDQCKPGSSPKAENGQGDNTTRAEEPDVPTHTPAAGASPATQGSELDPTKATAESADDTAPVDGTIANSHVPAIGLSADEPVAVSTSPEC
ncbi:hypothetical protein JX265_002885 [Neoarthrinium moseri]|uniref:Chromatin remodeling factor mit1 n=1 Tax=Neoarthrinium moseri TaxID=1658444 RepID=A0A9Q0APQ8_9PEZI|nr:hypothetical protein JX265_002885 [Neoarthrinium moseri]